MPFDPNEKYYGSRCIDANGIRTHYVEAGSGPPLILIHGGGPGADARTNWYGCLPRFARKFRTIAIDMVGFGKTDKPDPASFTYSQDSRTDHVIAFIEAMKLAPVRLVGNSMGGMTSLGVSIKRPDLVQKLVLMGSAGIKTAELPAALAPTLQYDGTPEAMRKVIRTLTHPDLEIDPGIVAYRTELSNDPAVKKAYAAIMGWVRERRGLYFEDDEIRRAKVPTLVVGGKDDAIVTLDLNVRFLKLIENSRGYFIPRCGHWVMIEYPEEFCDVTERFLES